MAGYEDEHISAQLSQPRTQSLSAAIIYLDIVICALLLLITTPRIPLYISAMYITPVLDARSRPCITLPLYLCRHWVSYIEITPFSCLEV